MPGSKQVNYTDGTNALAENPVGTRHLQDSHRELLPVGYPEDLSVNSSPETGSIGTKGMPITNKKSPFGGR